MKFQISNLKNKKHAFTLVEIVVSLGVFSVVAVVALGALVRIITANKKAQTLQSAMTNLTFSLESMSREMRVGAGYHCDSGNTVINPGVPFSAKSCTGQSNENNGTIIAFTSSKEDEDCAKKLIFSYRLEPNPDGTAWVLEKAEQAKCTDVINDIAYISIIDPNLVITGYYIDVRAADFGYYTYPLAIIRLSGYVGVREKERTYFDVQTAVSSRIK